MTTPAWAAETCPGATTDTTEVLDHYGRSHYPCNGVALFLAQRESTRHGVTLHDPARVVLHTERRATSLDAAGLRELARQALDLAADLDVLES